jgi:hypothetical protein
MIVKRSDGVVEEWRFAFSDWGLVLVGFKIRPSLRIT